MRRQGIAENQQKMTMNRLMEVLNNGLNRQGLKMTTLNIFSEIKDKRQIFSRQLEAIFKKANGNSRTETSETEIKNQKGGHNSKQEKLKKELINQKIS